MSFRLWKDKYPQREGKGYLVNVEWNQGKDKPISLWTMTEEHLEELRRVLDVGMGDCDHCDAWTLYSSGKLETTSEQVDRNFVQHEVWLKGHSICISNHANRIADLETFNEDKTIRNRVDALETQIYSLNGTLRDVTKALNNVADEQYKIKDFVGMKHP